MEAVQVVEMKMEVGVEAVIQEVKKVRRSCLKDKSAEPKMKKAKVEPRHVSFSNTDHECAICRSDLDVCSGCSKPRLLTAVGGKARKSMRKTGNVCKCKCTCHLHDTSTENVAPVVRTEQEAGELDRDMARHKMEFAINYRIATAQRGTLVRLLGRRSQIREERKLYYANLHKLKDVLKWGRGEEPWDICEQPDWISDNESPGDGLTRVLKMFLNERDLNYIDALYYDDKWDDDAEELLSNKIHTIEVQGCRSMQCEVDLAYFEIAKKRLEVILQGRLMFLGKVTCDAIFPGQEISNMSQIEHLLSALDNLSAEEKLQLGDRVRNEFGDRGDIDIVRLIHLYDRLCGGAVPVVDGEFRCGSTTGEGGEDKDEDEAFLYDVCYLGIGVFEIAGKETQQNVLATKQELAKSVCQRVLLPRGRGVKGYTLPV